MATKLYSKQKRIELDPSGGKLGVAQRIIGAARERFFTHGFRGITMDELAEELGMSKKTLYAHYPSKSGLVDAVIGIKAKEIEADLAEITRASELQFLPALKELLACVQRHSEEIKAPWLRDIQRDAPEKARQIEAQRRAVIQHYFGKLLNEGRKAKVIRKDIPTKLVVEILLAAVEAIMRPAKLAELGITPSAGFVAVVSVVFDGVLSAPGAAQR